MYIKQGIKGVLNFQDDVVVIERTNEEYLENLRQVFKRLSEVGLRLRLRKCAYFQE